MQEVLRLCITHPGAATFAIAESLISLQVWTCLYRGGLAVCKRSHQRGLLSPDDKRFEFLTDVSVSGDGFTPLHLAAAFGHAAGEPALRD
eukprot:767137-Hanusia_phi.AAC.22